MFGEKNLFKLQFANALKLCALFSLTLYQSYLLSQDTVALKNVVIISTKNQLFRIGKKTEVIDSNAKASFRMNSIGDILSFNSPVFIKSYGPGALATTAFRGGNASQTALLWNGFNIQNPMLGQTDLSLLPSLLFDNIEIEYGGSSALWGSGSVGGSIHLNNSTRFNSGNNFMTSFSGGSFNTKKISTMFSVSGEKYASSTKLYSFFSENNYYYINPENVKMNLNHARYNFDGILQELKFKISSKQILSVNAWINKNERQIPSYNFYQTNKTWQWDASARLSANWTYVNNKFKTVIKSAYLQDKIIYNDSVSEIFSKAISKNIIAENENYYSLNKNIELIFGVNYTSSKGISSNYNKQKQFDKIAAQSGIKFSFFNHRWLNFTSVRAEKISTGALPITSNLNSEFLITKKITLMASVASVYRQPTLNELYWFSGGNVNLKPEQGITSEGSLNYKNTFKHIFLKINFAAFNRKINNWIFWLPVANGNPSPENVQQVWSRGTETNWQIVYTKNYFSSGINLNTSYILSTVTKDALPNSSSLDRQLIYTPRYLASGSFFIKAKNISLSYFQNYTGYRFTSSDNLNWLNPFTVAVLKLNSEIKLEKMNVNYFFSVNNLFNAQYAVIAARPMPMRNYEFGITFSFKNQKNQN